VAKRSASAIGRQSRAKGNAWEREVAQMFRDAGFPEAKRQLNQWRKSGGVDLIDVGRYVPQCMKSKAPNAFKKFAEAVAECKNPGQIPVALLHKDASAPGEKSVSIAVVPIEWFFQIIRSMQILSDREMSKSSTLPEKEG